MAETVSIGQSIEYELKNLSIATKYGTFDIRGIFDEINLHDSVLQPCMSGNIVIVDAVGLSNSLNYDGSEFLNIEVSKKGTFLNVKKRFHIYKQSNRTSINQNSESYILHFVSDEYTYSEQQTVLQSYPNTYSNAVKNILTKYLKVGSDKLNGIIENSQGTRRIVIPSMKPFETINWCSKRALDPKGKPTFLFFENIYGYNFVSTTTLFKQPTVMNINFSPKNITDSLGIEFFGARAYEVISQYDYIDSTRSGVYAGTFVGYDTLTRTYIKKQINFNDIYGGDGANKNGKTTNYINKGNLKETQMYDARRVVFPFALNRGATQYIKDNSPESIQSDESPEKWYFQREAIFQNIMAQRVKLVMPGNFALTSGATVNMLVPTKGVKADNDIGNDQSLYGKYLIISTRHIIKYDRHETILEVVTDSTNENTPISTSPAGSSPTSGTSWLGSLGQ
jgi:hypothetical protein